MGVQVVRVTLDWYAIEAEQGTYDWARDGHAARRASRGRASTPVVAIWGTPAWANGGGGRTCRRRRRRRSPSFARAAAERFPWVRRWIVWNEPNQRRWLLPPSPAVYVTKLLNPGGAAIKGVIPQGVDRRRRDRSARRERWDVAGRLHPRHGSRGRASRRVRPPSAPALSRGDAVHRRLRRGADDQHGHPRPARRRDASGLRAAHAHLADRARVPDEPAGPDPRRDLGEAGTVRRRGAAARVPRRAGSTCSSSTSSATSRSSARGRAGSRPWPAAAKPADGLVLAPARAGLPHGSRDDASGARCVPATGPRRTCSSAVRRTGSRRRRRGDERAGSSSGRAGTRAPSCGSTPARSARRRRRAILQQRRYATRSAPPRQREPDADELNAAQALVEHERREECRRHRVERREHRRDRDGPRCSASRSVTPAPTSRRRSARSAGRRRGRPRRLA